MFTNGYKNKIITREIDNTKKQIEYAMTKYKYGPIISVEPMCELFDLGDNLDEYIDRVYMSKIANEVMIDKSENKEDLLYYLNVVDELLLSLLKYKYLIGMLNKTIK